MRSRSSCGASRSTLLLLVALLAAATLYLTLPAPELGSPPAAPPAPGAPLAVAIPTSPASLATGRHAQPRTIQSGSPLLGAEPAQMREALHDAYRALPDRRCTAAAETVSGWFGAPGPATASFAAGEWRVRVGDVEFGRLPEVPDFDDCEALLTDWIGRHAPAAAADAAPAAWPEDVEPAALFATLRTIRAEGFPGKSEASDLARAARAGVLIATFSLDEVEVADALLARVWALHAVASTRAPGGASADRALLASRLGYSEAAARAASSLPPRDPVRLFAERRTDDLVTEARATGSTMLTRALALLRVADRSDYGTWISLLRAQWASTPFASVVLQSAIELDAFGPNRLYGEVVPYFVHMQVVSERAVPPIEIGRLIDFFAGDREAAALAISTAARVLQIEPGRWISKFEHDLEIACDRAPAPVLDVTSFRSFYEGYFFSALHTLARFRLDQYASIPAARQLLASFDGAASPAAAGFARWYRNVIEAREGKPNLDALADDLAGGHPFGRRLRERTFDAIERYVEWGDARRFDLMRRLSIGLDSRASHLDLFADETYSFLEDVDAAEPIYAHVARLDGRASTSVRTFLAAFRADWAAVGVLLDDPELPSAARVDLLKRVAREKPPGISLDDERRKALARDRASVSLTMEVADQLILAGRPKHAEQVLRDWLALDLPDPGLDRATVTTRLARAVAADGRLAEALTHAEAAAEAGQAGAIVRKGLILDALGRADEAEAAFEDVARRYPQTRFLAVNLAEHHWTHGRPDVAAKKIGTWPGGWTGEAVLSELQPAFDRAFSARSDEEVLAAFRALVAAGVAHEALAPLAHPFTARDGRHALAFAMLDGLQAPGMRQLWLWMPAFEALERAKGRDEALRWLDAKLPKEGREVLAVLFYEFGRADLLWDLIPRPAENDHGAWVWLFRAAAGLRFGALDADRRRELEQYFSTPRPDAVHVLGAYLLGRIDESAFWKRAIDARSRAEGAFFSGIRALCDGRPHDAAAWWRVTTEIASLRMGEFRLARAELRSWLEDGRSLDVRPRRCEPKPEKKPKPPEPR